MSMSSRRSVLLSLLVSCCAALLGAQQSPPAAGPARQSDLAAKVDATFARYTRGEVPGAVVLLGRGEQIVLQKAYGFADLERHVPLTVESVFDIGSTSKQFTAACILLLEADGKLRRSDKVRHHVRELPECYADVTLQHLLLHTSGIPDYIDLMQRAGAQLEDRTGPDEALAALQRVERLDFACGSKWEYSNSNYFLLAEIVERATGRPLHEFAAERVFAPLKMTRTHIHTDVNQLVPDRALSYTKDSRGRWRWVFSNWEQAGDGAVMTTVGDLFLWSRNFRNGTVGGDALLATMAKPGALDDGTPLIYGMGLMFVELHGKATVSHGGAWAAYRADLLRIPDEDLVVICVCNRDDANPSELCARVAKAALQ